MCGAGDDISNHPNYSDWDTENFVTKINDLAIRS